MASPSLPAQSTPFIGRDDELVQIRERLGNPACRLLTLVGPGGIGKTRLALQIASLALDDYADGVYFVPLAPLKETSNLITTIANTLHFPFNQGNDPRQQFLDFLQAKQLFLILDNFEHLLAGVALVSDMLDAAVALKILVTSRETLNLQQEWVQHINGLSFPAHDAIPNPEHFGSVQLFTECASHVQTGFSLERDRQNVIRICQLVEGIPLAIELAAAWLKTLSCEDVAQEINRNLDFLSTSLRNVPARHQSLRAVFSWSWMLLNDDERNVFRKLAVLQGGFRSQAAEAVTGASLRMLSALVGKSLVKHTDSGRYEIHELLRQYGAEQLNEAGETEVAQNAHCLFFAEFLHQREIDLKGKRQLAALSEIEADFENIRTAWRWAASQKLTGPLTAAMGSVLLFCEMKSRFQEGRNLFEFASEQYSEPTDPTSSYMLQCLMARKVRIETLGYLSHHDESRSQIEKCLEFARERGDVAETAFCLSTLGEIMASSENKTDAITSFENCLKFYRQVGDKFQQGRILQRLGLCQFETRFDLFARFAQEGYDVSRDAGDRLGMANCLYNLGTVNGLSGNHVMEERYFSEALEIRREYGDLANISVNISGLCHVVIFTGNLERASILAHEALEIANRINHADGRNFALMELGFLAVLREDYVQGQRLCEESRAITTRIAVNPLRTALVDIYLSLIAFGLEDYDASRRHFHNGLQFAASSGLIEPIKWCLTTAALLKAHDGFYEQAVELLALACHIPATQNGWVDRSPLFARLRTRLEEAVNANTFGKLWARGSDKGFADIVGVLERCQLLPVPVEAEAPKDERVRVSAEREDALTDRELEMLLLIAAGLSNHEIAQQLVIGVSTVKKHINHIFSKLGVTNRTQAIVRARELNLL